MITKIQSAVINGIETQLIQVELSIRTGSYHRFNIVGMGDKSIQESRKRVTSALEVLGIDLSELHIMVNLAPAHIKKIGSHFDFAIAVGLLIYLKKIKLSESFLKETVFLGELSFDGNLNTVHGAMTIALDADRLGIKRLIVPQDNYIKAPELKNIEIVGVSGLRDFISYIKNDNWQQKYSHQCFESLDPYNDFSDIKGQKIAKRMLQIAAAGNHNCILVGPPGSGKSMLAKALPSIMPPLSGSERMDINRIHSVAGDLMKSFIQNRPFRNPHYGISQAGMVGGGNPVRPGEISLAHRGVLFLDELTEFKRSTIEALRQPLEDRMVTISRAQSSLDVPCSFLLLAAMNPCPCGNLGDNKRSCSCSPLTIYSYLKKISGPFLDRIDLQVFIMSVDIKDLHQSEIDGDSVSLYKQVEIARAVQQKRYNSITHTNAYITPTEVEEYAPLNVECRKLLDFAFEKFEMSMRSYHKIIKVARTIADMAGEDNIQEPHIKEALMYRGIEQKLLMLKKKI